MIRPYMNGRDLTSRPRGVFVIDFALLSEEEAKKYPLLFNIVRDRVKPQRDANKMASRKRFWWRFGAAGQNLRDATAGLNRMIATPYVSRFRFFTFLDTAVAPDEKLVCVALSDAYSLGVLSSRLHADWAQAAGSRLGVGNDLTYNNTLCFDPFPFPDPPLELRERIAEVAERLDRHRKEALERDEQVTMTGMYNVVEKLRSGEALTPRERKVHELAACGILRDLHDELDALVAEAYGWPWPLPTEEILARLVALHDERVAEEAAGKVRWLRPEYQRPRFGEDVVEQAEAALETPRATARRKTGRPEWPASAVEQMAALQERLAEAPLTVDEAVAAFRGARRELVERHLETLEIMGEVRRAEEGRYHWIGG